MPKYIRERCTVLPFGLDCVLLLHCTRAGDLHSSAVSIGVFTVPQLGFPSLFNAQRVFHCLATSARDVELISPSRFSLHTPQLDLNLNSRLNLILNWFKL